MEQSRLFRLAVDAMAIHGSFVPGEGWRLSVQLRRGDETWEEARRADYSHLQTPELCDVICGELETQMGL